jgi:predicted HTH transcriptional regulator
MALPPLPSDEELCKMEKFPYLEGYQFEYKQSLAPSKFQKMDETICAFLNSGGGYFIIGVVDLTLKIQWVEYTCKEIDKILLRVDDIFHRRTIHCDGEAVDPNCIQSKIVSKIVDGIKKYLIIITVLPIPGKLYRCEDRIWYRLNASNFGLIDKKMYNAVQVNTMVTQAINRTQECYTAFVSNQMSTINKLEKRLAQAQKKESGAYELLEAKILQEKVAAETALRKEKHSSFFTMLFDCLCF